MAEVCLFDPAAKLTYGMNGLKFSRGVADI
jgi:hypothetical protein